MTISPHTQTFALKRHGLSPVCFNGALLVQGRSYSGDHSGQYGSQVGGGGQAGVTFSVAVYESGHAFVAHICLHTSSHMGDLSFVYTSQDPVALRHWFFSFDPDLGVDLADIAATTDGPNAGGVNAFAKACAVIEERRAQARGAYSSALHTAFGRTTETKLAA